jgi:hypothetical protein
MARGKASIGELAHELILSIGNRFLWNFRIMDSFRGLGIYPALLQYIIHYESEKADRFWIIHAPENRSSLKGIQKGGFYHVGKLYSKEGVAIMKTPTYPKAAANCLQKWTFPSPMKNRRPAAIVVVLI